MEHKKSNSTYRAGWNSCLAATLVLAAVLFAATVVFATEEDPTIRKVEVTTMEQFKAGGGVHYKDIFDQSLYYEGVNQIDLSRWMRKIFRKPVPSADVNIFDEVPDSTFFVNRHARKRLSPAELEKGAGGTSGPDLSQPLTVVAIEQRGLNFQFIVEDVKGDEYLLKFDPIMNLELSTAAEVIASRFYYAAGYFVPQYTLLSLRPEQLRLDPDSITRDNTGFSKNLTSDTLSRYLISIPRTPQGEYRASAQKIPKGDDLGNFSFLTRRKSDPQDPVNHRDRREIRALSVFAAWLNDTGLSESNTLAVSTGENGSPVVEHYLTDFTNTLGATANGPKSPALGHEYMVDYGETFKTILALGFREKPWQQKWREAGEKQSSLPGVGYFSNHFFDPAKFKTQLPYEAFKIITRADGFWAAKVIMSFSNEDIRAMVKAGRYTDPAAADYVAKTLIERRNMIGRHWFSRANPLDDFELSNGTLSFKDLVVEYGFENKEGTIYSIEIFSTGKKGERLAALSVSEPFVTLDPAWFARSPQSKIEAVIRVSRPASPEQSPFVKVLLDPDGIQGIRHEN